MSNKILNAMKNKAKNMLFDTAEQISNSASTLAKQAHTHVNAKKTFHLKQHGRSTSLKYEFIDDTGTCTYSLREKLGLREKCVLSLHDNSTVGEIVV